MVWDGFVWCYWLFFGCMNLDSRCIPKGVMILSMINTQML